MALSVGDATSGTISGVGDATSSTIPLGSADSYYYSPGGTNGVIGTFSSTAPQTLGDSTTSTSDTGGGSYTDPYAQWGGIDAYNNLINGYNTQLQTLESTAGDVATNYGQNTNLGVKQYLQDLALGQSAIDNKAINNELALRQGREGVNGMVGRGIRSGGVLLANKNASDSSAAGALARAYGDIGRRQLSSVGNQYELQNRNIASDQNAFNVKKGQKFESYQQDKTNQINSIVLDARNKLAALEASMVGDKLTPNFNVEAEKEKIRQDALNKLSFLDQQFSRINTEVNPLDAAARRTQATQLASAGQAPSDSFTFTDQVPAQFQGSGLPSELPLFSVPRSSKTQ